MIELGASIIHINVIEFYAAIAVAKERSLREKAFVIAQDETHKATILSSSAHARKEGIDKGMSVASARRLVPNLLVITPYEKEYRAVQRSMYEIACEYTPSIQNGCNGHLYLDMNGTYRLFGPAVDSASHLSRTIQEKLSIHPAIAVASNRLVAKIATRTIRPFGITHVPQGEERIFLSSQDISFLPGLSASTKNLLKSAGMKEIGSIALLDDEMSIALLGKDGIILRNRALGKDNNEFDSPRLQEKGIEAHVDFAHSTHKVTTIKAGFIQAMVEIGVKLRATSMSCSRLYATIHWIDTKISSSSVTTKKNLVRDSDLITLIDPLLEKGLNRRVEVIAITLKATALSSHIEEGSLFEEDSIEKMKQVQHSVDAVRKRFGNSTIITASGLYSD